MDITIRDAVPTDVPFLARCVMAAVGTLDMAEKAEDNPAYETICELCAMEHSLYCWNHFRVAVDTKTGEPIGSLLAYDGKRYARARDLAFSYAAEKTGTDLGDSDMETCKGEYYLDSMAILPQYRGHKIGHALIQDATEQGKLVFAIPGTVGSGNAGTNLLIKNGTPAATDPQDIIAALTPLYPERLRGYAPAATAKLRSYGNTISKPSQNKPKPAIEAKISQKPVLNEDRCELTFSGATSEIILSALKDKKPMTADEICQQTGLNISEVMTELTMMEIDGSVVASVGGRYTSKF